MCIEKTGEIIKILRALDVEKIKEVLEFVKSSFHDSSKWVKSTAFNNFGEIIHQVYLKVGADSGAPEVSALKLQISSCCSLFYDPSIISPFSLEGENNQICSSFMGAPTDDLDKIKYSWAFNMPCILLVNGGQSFWQQRAMSVYEMLSKEIILNIRKTLASSLVEVMKLVNMKDETN